MPFLAVPVYVADVGSAFAAVDETFTISDAAGALSVLQNYPLAASAAALLVVGGVALAVSSSKPRSQATGAKEAFEALKAEERTVLVDLRTKTALRKEGVIDLAEANKKALSLVFAEPDEEGDPVPDPEFAAKLQGLAGVTAESIVVLVDSDGSLAPKAAAEAAQAGFFTEKVYWVRDGMEGPKGWKACGLPTKPYRVFELPSLELPSVDLSALAAELQAQLPGVDINSTVEKVGETVTTLTEKYKENPSVANGVLAVAGVAAVGAFAITELEAILQVVGALGLARFVATNLLFAKDREATLASVRLFLKDRGLDSTPDTASSDSGRSATAAAAAAADSGGALQQLASIVLGAKDADSAAQQITEQLLPDVEGADAAALAAALAAAGVPLAPPAPPTLAPQAAADPLPAETTPQAAPKPVPEVAAGAVVPVVTAAAGFGAVAEPREEAVVAPAETGLAVSATALGELPAAEEEVLPPSNVADARQWIAAWKAAQQQELQPVVIGGDGAYESTPAEQREEAEVSSTVKVVA